MPRRFNDLYCYTLWLSLGLFIGCAVGIFVHIRVKQNDIDREWTKYQCNVNSTSEVFFSPRTVTLGGCGQCNDNLLPCYYFVEHNFTGSCCHHDVCESDGEGKESIRELLRIPQVTALLHPYGEVIVTIQVLCNTNNAVQRCNHLLYLNNKSTECFYNGQDIGLERPTADTMDVVVGFLIVGCILGGAGFMASSDMMDNVVFESIRQ